LGIEHHLHERYYVRGAAGVGWVGEDTNSRSFSGGSGIGLSAAIGYDLVQLPRAAVSLELMGDLTRYTRELWGTAGLNLALSLF
jgi:hypothetical protein